MPALVVFLSLFVGLPLLELYVLIQVGGEIGALSTVLLSVLTALIGGYLVRLQGLSVLMRARLSLAQGEVPALALIEGLMLLVAGFMLLLPGFLTDTLGFALLLPPVRKLLMLPMVEGIMTRQAAATAQRQGGEAGPRVIEGEYRRDE